MRKIIGLGVAMAAMATVQSASAQNDGNCAAGPFMLFFDADSYNITPQAAAILDNVASAYATCGRPQLATISGHTDTKGDASYNVGLSQRMADATHAYLAAKGVPVSAMATEAFGESRLLIETKDGVREPQNRRVEIRFGPDSGW